jgi:hypothetical protein
VFGHLERAGYTVWLDFQNLVPGKPWQEQIDAGISGSDTMLLVVSQEAIASPNVEHEWRRAIALNKRIILLIFQAVPLPVELQNCEWIDFRGQFRDSIRKLKVQIELPAPQKLAVPQSGFKLPLGVQLTVAAASLVSLASLSSWWAIYIPFYLLPLPYRIIRRDFNFYRVQNALLMLPLTALLQMHRLPEAGFRHFVSMIALYASFLITPLLFFLLRSPTLRRWGKPIASPPRFAKPLIPEIQQPAPVRFVIDHAPEDAEYAEAIAEQFQEYGHCPVAPTEPPEVVVVLISEFKGSSTFDPEEHLVYPVILQANQAIDPKLKRVQWLDYRRGLRHLDRFAQLLPEPTKLLKALGIMPLGKQTVLPAMIQALVFYLSFLAVLTVGGWLTFILEPNYRISLQEAAIILALVGVFLGSTIVTIESLIHRKGLVTSLWRLVTILLLLGTTSWLQMGLVFDDMVLQTSGWNFLWKPAVLIQMIALVGLCWMVLMSVWYWEDLLRWFPKKNLGKRFQSDGRTTELCQ